MIRIRRILDDTNPADAATIVDVQNLLRAQFPLLREEEVASLPAKLRTAPPSAFVYHLLVAEDELSRLRGFALMSHNPRLHFSYLDYLAAGKRIPRPGVGGALYTRVREACSARGAAALFLECLPDDPTQVSAPDVLANNVARLRFYERFGARPLARCAYDAPIKPGDRGMPYLVCDLLNDTGTLPRPFVQAAVRSILEEKYAHLCPPDYIQRVVDSFLDDPVNLREPRYIPQPRTEKPPAHLTTAGRVVLVVNDKHEIHHVRERGYVEAPVRISMILKALEPSGLFERIPPKAFPERCIRAVHDADYVRYLKNVCNQVPPGKSVYPYVFPIRNQARPPKELAIRAGYFCIDTFTPLNRNAFLAAKRAVDCTLTAAEALTRGAHLAYALVRPPGHHAERRAFGGFCYFNNCAVAARHLNRLGRVAILDIDYHHGNGQQVIFFDDPSVLTLSIHGHPQFAYPYFSGFRDEKGTGAGLGYTVNYPMPETTTAADYRIVLKRAVKRIMRYRPAYLIVALGLDPAKDDPTGSWSFGAKDFEQNGRLIGSLRLPTLVVQEGGYRTRTLGANALAFFRGLVQASEKVPSPAPARNHVTAQHSAAKAPPI